jgi:hypothetical protein
MPEIVVPTDKEGRPRFSITQFRTFGAADLVLDGMETPRGCPYQYKRKYVTKDVPRQERPAPLARGSLFHDVLHTMERDSVGPEEALEVCWPPRMPPNEFGVVKEVLMKYLDRGGPMVRYGTLDHELDLTVQLYVDDDFGPVMFRGILDWLGLDLQDQSLLHCVDYKSNLQPPKTADLRGDLQLLSQNWLLHRDEVWNRYLRGQPKRTVMHLDAIRYRDVAVRFTPGELEEWHAWAVAVARRILRETDWRPSLNPGCSYCPVQHDCFKWQELPGTAETVAMRRTGEEPEQVWTRLQELKRVKKLVDDAAKTAQTKLEDLTRVRKVLQVGDEVWTLDTGWETEVDYDGLQSILGDRFVLAVSTSKAAVERATAGMPAADRHAALAMLTRLPAGQYVKKTKAE